MTTLTQGVLPTESLVSEASGERSRAAITVKNTAVVTACMVLGMIQSGTPTVSAGTAVSGSGGTVGNGTVGTWTADAGAQAGVWTLRFTAEATDLGKYEVIRPDGTIDGVGTVGTAYNGGINGTLADGSADWKEDDSIPVTVAYLDGDSAALYLPYNQDGTDGSQVAAGISYGNYDATNGAVSGVAFVRDCEHNADIVVWPSDITADEKAKGITQLLALGIVLR